MTVPIRAELLQDPATLTLTVHRPDGKRDRFQISDLTREAAGVYALDYTESTPGEHHYEFRSTVPPMTHKGTFTVQTALMQPETLFGAPTPNPVPPRWVARLMKDTATILTLTLGSPTGGHNNPTQTWTPATAIPALFQPQASTEVIQNEDFTTIRGTMIVGPSAAISTTSRVQLGSIPSVTWRVVGDPALQTGLDSRPSHLQVVLERVVSS